MSRSYLKFCVKYTFEILEVKFKSYQCNFSAKMKCQGMIAQAYPLAGDKILVQF